MNNQQSSTPESDKPETASRELTNTDAIKKEESRQVLDNNTNQQINQNIHKNSLQSFFHKHSRKIAALGVVVGGMLSVTGYQTLFGKIEQNKQMIEVTEGQTLYGMMDKWQQQVPMFSSTIAKLYIKLKAGNGLHLGSYQFPQNPSFSQAVNILSQGSNAAMVKVQIIEGKTAKDLYATLQDSQGIKIEVLDKPESLKSALGINATTPAGEFSNNLEGWFAPDTYYYAEGTTDKKILLDLYARQQKALDEAWQNRAKDLPYKTAYDALIMASIIEKETSLPEERAEVAGVFVNRLKQGMRLQTDPTIIYGMGERYDGDIRTKDIKEKTAYNTYQINGLPPTPIALPSKASIEAALNPADTNAVYFVATGNGGHKFSSTLDEHNKAVQAYLQVMKEKGN